MATLIGKNTLLKKRSVVSSFIIKRVRGEQGHTQTKVALFKRSGKVNTYQHHWAPISGSIEAGTDASPLAAAWRELREETTLTDASLELLRHGKSYVFADPSVGREWTIYPFLFQLRPEAKDIEIDWEHEGWAWFNPADVEDTDAFGAVPHLAKSLRRVWFEYDLGEAPGSAGALLEAGLGKLKNDYQSGARQLAGVALGILQDVIRALPPANTDTDTDAWWTRVRFAAWHIWKNGRESMGAAILNVLLDALTTMEEGLVPNKDPVISMRDKAVGVLDGKIAARASSSSMGSVADALLIYLEQSVPARTTSTTPATLSILTLSESSTITYFLQQLALKLPSRFKRVDLRVLESRPLFEGVSLAASIAQFVRENSLCTPDFHITVYTDASMAMAAAGADIVLLGADRIASSGAVSNKTGSLPAVLCAKHCPSPVLPRVVVLGETDKIASPGDPDAHVVEENDPAQVSRAWHSSSSSERVRAAAAALGGIDTNTKGTCTVRNVFFEWVPPELVDVYVTEKGVWTLQDIERHSRVLGQEEERLFGEL